MRKVLPRLRLPQGGQRLGASWLLGFSLAFTFAALAAGVLGVIGILTINAREGYRLNPFDVAHGIIQLYAGQTPPWLRNDAELPTSYDIAKVAAPMSTGYVFFTTATILLAERWRFLRARLARGHSIVCGGGRSGVFLSRSLASNSTTVFVDQDASSERVATSLVRGIVPISGDARDSVVLRRAGLHRALAVFAVAEEADVNAAVAMSARQLIADRDTPLDCYAVIDDPELQIALQARILSNVTTAGFRLHLLDRDQLFASAVMRVNPPDPSADNVVAGSGPLAVALTVEAAKALIASPAATGGRPRLSVAGPQSQDLLKAVTCRLPGVAGRITLDVARASSTAGNGPATSGQHRPLDTVYVCGQTDPETIKTGFTWLNNGSGKPSRVVFCVEAETGLSGALTPGNERLLDDAGGLIRIHSRTLALSEPEHLKSQSLTEKLAHALHAEYLAHMAGSRSSATPSQSLKPWDGLSDTLKNSNRDQARHIARKLATLRCVLVPFGTSLPEFAFREQEIDLLARSEHDRWQEERLRAGVRYGPERTAQTHPDLVPWHELTEEAQEKDRIFIRALPRLLAHEGLVIVRLPHRDGDGAAPQA